VTAPASNPPLTVPRHLVVIGAAAGIGRWLGEHVLGWGPSGETGPSWESVTLIDASEQILNLESSYVGLVTREQIRDNTVDANSPLKAKLNRPQTLLLLAVPLAGVAQVASLLLPMLAPDAVVVDTSHDRTRAEEILSSVRSEIAHVGLHALFGVTAERADGQIFAVCPSNHSPDAHRWLTTAIEAAGGTVNELASKKHDEIMRYVQTAAHQSLLSFVGALGSSGLDLEKDLWANRTPVFELLLALASRVLAPGQESTTASIQLADETRTTGEELHVAHQQLLRTLSGADPEHALTDYLAELRSPFPGGLFTKIQQAGVLATSAVQSTRARVAEHGRSDALVGVRSLVQGDRLHVGRVIRVSATDFTLTDLLVGSKGNAALLSDEAAIANARKLGVAGKPKNVSFSLGRVQLLNPSELESELDEWLAVASRGYKFLIPESISGASAVRVVESVDAVVRAELVSEEVRLGERECVVRFQARVDRNLVAVERAVQSRIDDVFVWPDGVILPLRTGDTPTSAIGFLGPSGTFSDIAARQCARLLKLDSVERREFPDFASLVSAVTDGVVPIAVVPITNSSSGLVDLAANVFSRAPEGLQAGGVIDVPVRFDAYIPHGTEFTQGIEVFSHPQGFRQCSAFISAHRLIEVPCTSTAEACRLVHERGHGVALAAAGLSTELDLDLARASVGNLAGALTRFLVIGMDGRFGAPARADATLRSIWIATADALAAASQADITAPSAPRFDEVLRGPSGLSLVVSTSTDRLASLPGARTLGTIPWSPRTPLVVV
jgi:prephenate dehydratase/prephenate dehydrogenase